MSSMRKDERHSLRKQAEDQLRSEYGKKLDVALSGADLAELVQELQIHQIELEIQNEELRRAQEDLSLSQQLFVNLFHRAPVGYLVLDKTGFVQDVNETFCKLTDFPASKIKGSTIFKLIAEKDRDWFIARYKAIYKHPEGKNIELSFLTSAGETLPASLNAAIYKHSGSDAADNSPLLLLTVNDISERLRAEQALQTQNDLLATVFESSPNILMLVNADGRVEKINRKGSEFSGSSQENLIGLLGGEVFRCINSFDGKGCGRNPECGNCPVRTRMQQSLQYGAIILNEEGQLTVRKDAQEKLLDFLISTVPVTIVNETKVLITIVDITKRKKVEEEIENLSKFPTENPNPVLRVQNDGQVIYANKASQELLDMWRCEINGYLPIDMKDLVSELAESGSNKSVDIPCNDKVYAVSLVPVAGSGYVNLYGSEITERKKAEGALQESEERLRQIASSLREVIWLRDAQTRQVLYVNPAFEELTGRPRESFFENRDLVIDAIHPEDKEGVIKALEQRFEGVPYDKEHRIVHLDGSVRWVSSRIFPVQNEAGEVYRWASIMEDITERKHAEDELRRTLDDLKRSNTELEQFAYVASHDLQEPLRGIAGMSQLLQKRYQGQLDDRADEYIGHIVDGTQRMQTLINDLLTYSRIGRRGEPIQATDAEAALQATLENLAMSIQEYGAAITNESLPRVQADSTQLIQLFQNLIGNALKFRAEERPPHIHIGVEEAGVFWQFSVHDNGIGIEPQYFERIFQVFQRLHTRREYKGTGIGLAICKKIVDRHGGRIWVESEAGQGTTFYFTLPKGK